MMILFGVYALSYIMIDFNLSVYRQ